MTPFQRNPGFDAAIRAAAASATRRGGEAVAAQVRQVLEDAPGGGTSYKRLPRPSSDAGEPPVVQSGQLLDSVAVSDVQSSAEASSVRVGTPLFYGRFLEGGTQHMASRPFLRPGLAQARDAVMACFQGALDGKGGAP